MPKKRRSQEEPQELKENEEFISRDDLDIEVRLTDNAEIIVMFSGFDEYEDADEYATFLAETLPLLLFETTRYARH